MARHASAGPPTDAMRKTPSVQSPRLSSISRRGRWAVRLCLLFPFLAFLIATALYCVHLGRLLLANLSPVVAAEITRVTGHETHIGRIYFRPWGTLMVNKIAVSSRQTFAESHGESLVSADRLTVHYNLAKLLFDSTDAVQGIGTVSLDHPTLLVERLTKKTFNFSDILKPSKPNTHPFIGEVIAHDGTLHFRDYAAPAIPSARPAYNTLAHVNATVNMHSSQMLYFTADGQGTQGRLDTVAVNGDSSRVVSGRFRLTAHITQANATYWVNYFNTSPQYQVLAGTANLDLTVARLSSRPPPGLPVDLLGNVTVQQGVVALHGPLWHGLVFRNTNVGATFAGSSVSFQTDTTVNNQALTANGTVFNFAHPQIALTASANALDAQALVRTMPSVHWPAGLRLARGTAAVSAVGSMNSPTLSATVAAPSLQYEGNRLVALRASGIFAKKTLSLTTFTFGTPGGGSASLHGTMLFGKTPQARLAGQAIGLDLAALRLPGASHLALGGRADAQVLADNTGHPLRLVANVAIARPRVSRTQLSSARARLVYVQGQGLTVSRALVRAPQGAALAAGTVPVGHSGHWNVRLDAAGLNLASLVGPYTTAPVGGLAYFQGSITGTGTVPRVSGQLQLVNPRYARFAADVVRGGLTVSSQGLRLDNMALNRFPTSAAVTGTIAQLASKNPALHLRVQVSQADVQDFLNLAAQFTPPNQPFSMAALPLLTGTAGGTFQIGGTEHDPQIAGRADVTDATVGEYRVNRLHVEASYGHGAVQVANAALQSEGATLTAHGMLALRTGRIHAAFHAQDVDLRRLRTLTDSYVDIDGGLATFGTLGGTLRAPTATAIVSLTDLSINRQSLGPLTLSGRYANGEFVKTGAPWILDFLPATSTDGHDIRYVVNALHLTLPTPLNPQRAPAINLDADIPADAPETVSHLLQTVRDSHFATSLPGARFLDRVNQLPQPLAGTMALPMVHVKGPFKAPSVQISVLVQNLVVGPNSLKTLSGTATFSDPLNPNASLSLQANDLLADGIPVSSLTAKASLTHHILSVSELRAVNQSAYLEASGQADLRPGGVLSADLDASNIPLSLLDSLVPQPASKINQRTLIGEIGSLSVSASGPTAAPNLTGSIALSNPGLAIGMPGKPPNAIYSLERIRSGAITLTTPTPGGAQVLTVSDLAAFQNGRPVAALSGSLPFQWRGRGSVLPALPGGEPLHAQLVIQDLSQLAPFVPALDPKRTSGALTVTLNASELGPNPHLTGIVDLAGGSIGLTGFQTALMKIGAHLTLDGDRVQIGHFSAASTKGGTLSVSSGDTMTLAHADLSLAANGFTIDETDKQTLLSRLYGESFRGKVNGAVNIGGPWLTPLISTLTGNPLILSDASATIPSAPETAGGTAVPSSFDPRLDLAVDLGTPQHTVSVSNALLRANAAGNAHLSGTLSQPDLRAHLAITRGQVLLPPATQLKFIRSGTGNTVDVRYPSPIPDASGQPQLQTYVDLTAQATVSVSQAQLAAFGSSIPQSGLGSGGVGQPSPLVGNTATTATSFGQSQSYTITAHVHGILNDPNLQIDLTSSPGGLSHEQMLVALSGIAGLQGLNSQAAFQSELASALTSTASSVLLTPLEDNIADSLGLTDFDVAYAPDAPVLVTLGKQLLPRLYVTYQRFLGPRSGGPTALGQPVQYTLKLSYGLTKQLQLSLSTDDQNNNTVALEDVLGF
jgi:autotransporter translocation and assembly factor TamB